MLDMDNAPLQLREDTAPTSTSSLVMRAKYDCVLIRNFGRQQEPLTNAELGMALGYRGPGGRNVVTRLLAGKASEAEATRLNALLNGWRF